MISENDVAMWLGGKNAGAYLGYSRDWVEVRALPWQPHPIDGRVRYRKMRGSGDRKYFRPDLDLFLEDP
jgi:hypothetical protein